MKVCILSMQNIQNFGSLLQAYSLKKTIEMLGAEAEFLDIEKIETDNKLLEDFSESYVYEREHTSRFSKLNRYLVNRIRNKLVEKKQSELFHDFRRDSLNVKAKSAEYDLCIIGSDEVFNCLNAGNWGFTSQLFGNVKEARRVITYAASCGSTKYEKLPQKVADRIKTVFTNVSAFSVRDQNTYDFVAKLSSEKININLDPVLIYDFDREISDAKLPELPERYCVIYAYANRIHTQKEISTIKAFCTNHKLTPICIGAGQYWCKNYVPCSPFECLKVFKNASFVITDTFHGTIFSAKYANKFAVITRPSNINKLNDLVNRIGITEHLLDDIGDLESKYQISKDDKAVNELINKEKNKALDYLRRCMNYGE